VLGISFLILKGVEYTAEYKEQLLPGLGFDFSEPHAHAVHFSFTWWRQDCMPGTSLSALSYLRSSGCARISVAVPTVHSPITVAVTRPNFPPIMNRWL